VTEKVDVLLQGLRREYLTEAPARLGELRKDLAAVRAGEPDATASLKARFHRLAGSGGSYGFTAISSASREAERWLIEHPVLDDEGFGFLGGVIGRVAAAFDEGARECGLPETTHRRPPFGWRAHLIGGATDLAARLTFALRDAQYAVSILPIHADPAATPASERPDIVVVIPAPGEDPGEAVGNWTAGMPDRRPAVALVANASDAEMLRDPLARLDLLVDLPQAVAEISRWARAVARAAATPAAILLVAGDEAERAALSGLLEGAGLRVTAAESAQEAAVALRREQPDLVLLDLDLPDADGTALVRLIRRSARLALTPVVALSNQDTEAVRDEARQVGVDELLIRGPAPDSVVSTVIQRAGRARRLDDAVRRDPLSGFLTVGSLLDEMESVLAYARREGERISFLILDIDHFRRVNEQLGHHIGDQVLAHLAGIIRERVRASDRAVRMGGEAFGVLLRHCGPADALVIAEKIRTAVMSTPPMVEGTPLPVRLSGGVAGYPDHAIGMRELLLAAERALRQAKESGRNRVSVSG
jgi:diguanylate cyclase (GGDEF)-like protein